VAANFYEEVMKNILTRWEEVYLIAILELKDNAYGVTIKKQIKERTGKTVSYGGLYFAMDQMVKKGLLRKIPGQPEAKQGGRTKFYYTLTEDGMKALKQTYAHQKTLWKGLEDYAY
jgi:DNA-binding PadR family transcriptional regulator